MYLCGPLAQLVKAYLDRKYGRKDVHYVTTGRRCFAVTHYSIQQIDCSSRIVPESRLCSERTRIDRPKVFVKAVITAAKHLALARIRVYEDPVKAVSLYIVPNPSSPLLSSVCFFEEFLVEVALHRDLRSFLEYLNDIGIHVPTDPLEIHDRLSLFESEFVLFVRSLIPRPRVVVDGRIVPRARRSKLAVEAFIPIERAHSAGLAAGDRVRVAIYALE